MDIKNALEVVVLLEKTAAAIKSAKANNVIDWRDAPDFLALIPAARAALADSEQIALELKDLDQKEAQELFSRMMAAGTALLAALTGVSKAA